VINVNLGKRRPATSGRRRAPSRRGRLAVALTAVTLAAAWIPTGSSVLALGANCTQTVATVTCTYTSGSNTFIVPKGVSTVHVVAVGGRGGTSAPNTAGFAGILGGHGARTTGDIAVTPGEPVYAIVGGNGSLGIGGSNGGGAGVAGLSGGGGGASDVRTSAPDLDSRLIVAAGGGGGGGNGAFYAVGGVGGDGASAGGDGTDLGGSCGGDPCYGRGGNGGAAGTASAGGAGGAGGHWADDPLLSFSGEDGELGAGGDAITCDGACGMQGGGGGGLYGGGAGGAGGLFGEDRDGGGSGGGGGGSNLVPAGGTSAVDSTGTAVIVISYTAPITVSPSSIDFGSQAIGSSSAPRTVTLSDTGSASIVVGSVDVIGTNPGDFAITSDGCSGKTIAAGSTCTVQVTFGPAATGARYATLRLNDDAADGPHYVSLSGTGTTLGDVRVGITGPSSAPSNSQNTYAFTVTNAGPSSALNVVMTAQVPNGTKFIGLTTTQGTCTRPASGATSGTITCSLGTLASGSAAVNTATLKIVLSGKGGSIMNVAQAYSTGIGATPDPNLANNIASFSTSIAKR
jgi:uncharacterized repeat protein (TIGR01451 family)